MARNIDHILDNLDDNFIYVFITVKAGSEFANRNIAEFANAHIFLSENDTKVFFLTETLESNPDYIQDKDHVIANMSESLNGAKNVGDNILFCNVVEDKLNLLQIKEAPDIAEDWSEVVSQFIRNFKDSEPDEGLLWRWGQIIPESGEYTCVDCGHVEEFVEGQVFPICDVCLSGEIDGPSTPSEGFWEKV